MKRKLKYIITLILLIATLSLGVFLRQLPYFDYVTIYSEPYCMNDFTVFTSDTCSKCNSNIRDSGKIKNAVGSEFRNFELVFKSYDDYIKVRNSTRIYCYIDFALLASILIELVIFHFIERKEKDAE